MMKKRMLESAARQANKNKMEMGHEIVKKRVWIVIECVAFIVIDIY